MKIEVGENHIGRAKLDRRNAPDFFCKNKRNASSSIDFAAPLGAVTRTSAHSVGTECKVCAIETTLCAYRTEEAAELEGDDAYTTKCAVCGDRMCIVCNIYHSVCTELREQPNRVAMGRAERKAKLGGDGLGSGKRHMGWRRVGLREEPDWVATCGI